MQPWLHQMLEELREGLEGLYGQRLRGVFLFGSHARGEAHRGSDVDVLIVLDVVSDYYGEIRRTSRLNAELSLRYGASLSRVFVDQKSWETRDDSLLRNVRHDAVAA